MNAKSFLVSCIFILFCINSFATHIVGGELNYKHLGGWYYEIKLTVYRDCWVGVPPFDDPAALGVFDSNNNRITYYNLRFAGLDTLKPTISDPCMLPPTDFCYEVTTYIDTIQLPPIPGGYQLAYQRCCRNQFVLNIQDPEGTGATYYATIPDTLMVKNNSNPVFKNWPPPFICANKLLSFDHSATDIDGDSLIYELYIPNAGASQFAPQPVPPNNPPYPKVIFVPPYSLTDMLGGSQPLSINSQTGLLTAIPATLGYFVIGIICKEYRNGVLIGETKRDYQFIVKDCPKVVTAAATVPNVTCGSPIVSFVNGSTGASTYSWHFGDSTVTNDSSNVFEPTYTYPTIGTYSVTLIAYATGSSACIDSTTTLLIIREKISGSYSFVQSKCKPNEFYFSGISAIFPGFQVQYKWYFGDGFTLVGLEGDSIPSSPKGILNNDGTTSNTYNNPIHIYPTNENSYTTNLIVSLPDISNCTDTISVQIIQISEAKSLFVPNTFTPNNDGNNDIFRVRGSSFENFYFAVYNRWGELMFETTNSNLGWDGVFNGKPSDPAVYAWYLKVSCPESNKEVFNKGNVTLIR